MPKKLIINDIKMTFKGEPKTTKNKIIETKTNLLH